MSPSLARAAVSRRALVLLVAAGAALPVSAQSRFATRVVDYSPGPNVPPGFADPARFLGGPQGGGISGGSSDVVTLGVGGSLTVGFAVTLTDGPGADLTVSENGFFFNGGVFAEVAFVEVSTDGVAFARFPTRYSGPAGPLPPFGSLPMGTFGGLCGGLPGLANVVTNQVDPFDPVVSGGEAFDLADLASDPLVLGGQVDLAEIHFLRLVDVEAGVHPDSFGNLIEDHGGATGSADVDAVSVLNHTGNVTGHQPLVDLRIDAAGYLILELGDPDGLRDLDLASLRASLDLQPISPLVLLRLMRVAGGSPRGVTLRSRAPVVGSGTPHALGISIRDRQGEFSGDQALLPG